MKTLKTRWRDIPWSEIAPMHGDVEKIFSNQWEKEQRGKEIIIMLPGKSHHINGCKELSYDIISGSPNNEPNWACCSHLAEIGD